jgi:beta-lactam-binding protein with PASTA domain
MTIRDRFERVLRLTLMIFVLAAAGFLSAVTAIRIAIRGRIVSMPNLVGQQVTEAEKSLGGRGLQIRVADRVYSSLPVNAVVRQSPRPGEQVKLSQNAHVVLSLGQQSVTIPPLEGFSVRAGRIALLQAGLQLGEVSNVALSSAEPDVVLKQNPPPGKAATKPSVDLLVAQLPPAPAYIMPSVVGLDEQEANRILSSDGLHIGKVNRITQAGAAKGTVIGQVPPRGSRIAENAVVELGISE